MMGGGVAINLYLTNFRRFLCILFEKYSLKILDNKKETLADSCLEWPFGFFHQGYRESVQFSPFQLLSRVRLFAIAWIAARQASLSITSSWSSLRLVSIESVMHPAISSSLVPFSSCPQSLPASESFPLSQLFAWGGQSTGVSALASFLPNNTQDRSPLAWTGWISLQSKGLSRVFSNTTVQKHQFFGTQLSSQSNSHPHMTTGKTMLLLSRFSHVRLCATP